MKARILISGLLMIVLLSGLILPAVAEGPSPEEQFKLGQITEKEYDQLAPQGPGCGPEAAWPGPDGFGYVGLQIPFDWVDITATGTLIAGLTDDGYQTGFPIAFTFNYYGTDYTTFDVANNGFMGFGLTSGSLTNQCPLPNNSTPNNVIALLWDDLYPNYTSGGVYYETFGTCPVAAGTGACLVLEYYSWNHFAGAAGSAGTWEAILYEDGAILLQFLDSGTETGSSSTTGIENNNYAEDWGLTYACNVDGTIPDELAILFSVLPGPNLMDSFKSAPAKATTGEPIVYEIEIINTGDMPALDASLVDPIPAGTTYVQDSLTCSSGTLCSYESGVVYWNGQVDETGEPVEIGFSVLPEVGCGETVVNVATIDDPGLIAPVEVEATTEVWDVVVLHEDFEGELFPPTGWVETHDPAGMAWTDEDPEPRGNLTGGTGKFAIVDDDYGGSAALTVAELWTLPLDIPLGYDTFLAFKTDYNNISANESADVDISLDGGSTWINLQHWNSDHRGPLTAMVDVTPYGGETGAIFRFYYDDGDAYAWWWEVDDVQVVGCVPPPAPDIEVSPTELNSSLCPDEQMTQELTICNVGEGELVWELSEMLPGSLALPPGITGSAPQVSARVAERPVITSPDQCAAYENYAGLEPVGWAELCAKGFSPPAPSASSPSAPTDFGYAQDIGYISDNFVTFALNDFSGQTVVATSSNVYYGMDFDPSGTVLYALNDTTDQLGTIDLTDGTFTALVPCAPPVDIWTGLTIDPVTGDFYASDATALYTIDPATGNSSLVGAFGPTLMIDIAINGEGEMYGHDIGTDSIYQIDPATGAATLIGPTGYAANYAQGLDFDNDDGTLYIFLYQGSGANVYGTVDLTTGAVSPLSVSDPLGEFEGATQTTAGPPPDLPWLSEDPTAGTVAPAGCQVVQVTFDSTGLTPDTYTGALSISSNDPDEQEVIVPVTLTVDPCGDTIHVEDIVGMWMGPYLVMKVQVADQDSIPMGNVLVDASATTPSLEWARWRYTRPSGWARFWAPLSLPGTYGICVDDLTLGGYFYDPNQNVYDCMYWDYP